MELIGRGEYVNRARDAGREDSVIDPDADDGHFECLKFLE
jgi:hypothetical protein